MATNEDAKMALAKQQHPSAQQGDGTVAGLIEQLRPQIERALPNTMSADRFARIVLTTLRTSPNLAKCNPHSLMAACMLSAQLGLEPGPLGHAYFVPFGKEVTFIIGYRGMLDLARRSGDIRSIEAREVCANDKFEYAFGLEPKLTHVPATGDRGEPTHYYGIAKFTDDSYYFEVLSKEDVDGYRKRSRASGSGPWVTDYSAMARKTVIRRMAPYLPLSPEAARAVASDEGVVTRLDDLTHDGSIGVRHDIIEIEAEEVPELDAGDLAKADLQTLLDEAGVKYDKRWSAEKLQQVYNDLTPAPEAPSQASVAQAGGSDGAPSQPVIPSAQTYNSPV
jgi:recombination protein RecT